MVILVHFDVLDQKKKTRSESYFQLVMVILVHFSRLGPKKKEPIEAYFQPVMVILVQFSRLGPKKKRTVLKRIFSLSWSYWYNFHVLDQKKKSF
jgi:hypothetical protein